MSQPGVLTLPYPPTLNMYWRKWRGRMVISTEGRAYKVTAATMARAAGLKPTASPVVMWLSFYRPRRIGDLDNIMKCLLDSLKGVAYNDDAQVVEIHAFRYDDKASPRVEIRIQECEAAGS